MTEDSQKERGLSQAEEIRELERRLAEKKRELAERGAPVPEEKEVLREVLRSRIEEARPAPPGEATQTPIGVPHKFVQSQKQIQDDLNKKEEREKKLRALIEIALTRTIADAVKKAQAENPYLLDELHDHLVDDYYDRLIKLRKIKDL